MTVDKLGGMAGYVFQRREERPLFPHTSLFNSVMLWVWLHTFFHRAAQRHSDEETDHWKWQFPALPEIREKEDESAEET